MKKYIKPTMKAKPLEMENCILAGSTSVGISEDPATGPALSKGNNFFDGEEDDDDYDAPSRRPSSLWDD
ncbi:toxin PIN [Tannerella forsythia]